MSILDIFKKTKYTTTGKVEFSEPWPAPPVTLPEEKKERTAEEMILVLIEATRCGLITWDWDIQSQSYVVFTSSRLPDPTYFDLKEEVDKHLPPIKHILHYNDKGFVSTWENRLLVEELYELVRETALDKHNRQMALDVKEIQDDLKETNKGT